MTNETTKVTEETMEMVADNSVEVIQAANDIVSGNDIKLGKVGKGAGIVIVVGIVGYGIYKLAKKYVPALNKSNDEKTETVECTSEDYTEAINEEDVAVEDLDGNTIE